MCFSRRECSHTHSHIKSCVTPAELFSYSQTPACEQRRHDEYGITTTPPAISLLPCLLLLCLSSSEPIPESWESAKSHKTNVGTPNVEGFSAELQKALESDKPQINAWSQLQERKLHWRSKPPTASPAKKTACVCSCELLKV